MPASVTRLQPLRLSRASVAAQGDVASAANAASLTRRFQYRLRTWGVCVSNAHGAHRRRSLEQAQRAPERLEAGAAGSQR